MADLDFVNWLSRKLGELSVDENVFGSYITGILEGEETAEEKVEGLEGILGAIIENDLNNVVQEIIAKWEERQPKKDEQETSKKLAEDVDAQLARMLESQKLQTTAPRQYTAEELKIREKILAQYSQTSISEEEGDEQSDSETQSNIAKNTNAQDVQQAQKERREQAKLDSQKKKEKDKEDRERQKQQREEKKEKRKTVKGERRR